jgi:hypothetical protein
MQDAQLLQPKQATYKTACFFFTLPQLPLLSCSASHQKHTNADSHAFSQQKLHILVTQTADEFPNAYSPVSITKQEK